MQEISYPGYLIKMNAGLQDDNAKIVQSRLIEKKGDGVGIYGADGYFGERTLKAVKRYGT